MQRSSPLICEKSPRWFHWATRKPGLSAFAYFTNTSSNASFWLIWLQRSISRRSGVLSLGSCQPTISGNLCVLMLLMPKLACIAAGVCRSIRYARNPFRQCSHRQLWR